MQKFKLTNLPVIRPGTMPSNVKMLDDLMNKKEMTHEECAQLDKILGNYQNA
jgi:hypothetical protein